MWLWDGFRVRVRIKVRRSVEGLNEYHVYVLGIKKVQSTEMVMVAVKVMVRVGVRGLKLRLGLQVG